MAASYGEEDVAEAWNSCVRLSCLEHGVTVHTAFDLVTPYPEFNPKFVLVRVCMVRFLRPVQNRSLTGY